MAAVSHKTKPFITLDTNLLDHSGIKGMEKTMKIKLRDLPLIQKLRRQKKKKKEDRL